LACQYLNQLTLDVFKLLIEIKGFDINLRDEKNNTPLFDAFNHFQPNSKNNDILSYLIDQKDVDINTKDVLHAACRNIKRLPLDVFVNLIEIKCCDITHLDKNHNTPLHLAFEGFDPICGDVAALKYLIGQKNTDFNIKNGVGMSLLQLAVIGKDINDSFQYIIVEEVIGGYLEQIVDENL
jgi:ankyrin repeat protein